MKATKQERTHVEYNKLVGKRSGEYYYLEYVFQDGDFKGAVGFELVPITFAEMEKRRDTFDEDGEYWKMAVAGGRTELGLDEWREHILNIDGDDAVIDLSWFYPHGEELLERLDPQHVEYEYTEGIGGGRCFDIDMVWDELYEPELWEIIKQYES